MPIATRQALLAAWMLAVLPAFAAAQPVGREFQVNTYTTLSQDTELSDHVVGADASGNFVVVWQSDGQDGSERGVFGQRYDSAGAPLGTEFRVNSYTPGDQRFPSVTSDASGNFVVVWQSLNQDGNGGGIFGQRYDSAGTPLGTEFRVNQDRPKTQSFPSVASDVSGNFVVVWQSSSQAPISYDIFGQRYDSAGAPLGTNFRVNSYTPDDQFRPSVACDASGNLVVVWDSDEQDGSSYGVFGQRYDSAGAPLGAEFRVNSYTTNWQSLPSVASDASGNFVVVWGSYFQDGSTGGIFGQRYDSAGSALGDEFLVNSFTQGSQVNASVASDAGGNFVVVWSSSSQDGSKFGIFGQRYVSAGVAQGDEFQINSYTTDTQRQPSVAMTGTNWFIGVWTSYRQDGFFDGVFGRRFDFGADTIKDVSPRPAN